MSPSGDIKIVTVLYVYSGYFYYLLYNIIYIIMGYRILSIQQVEQARLLRNRGYTKNEIARELDVAPTTLWYTLYGRSKKTTRSYKKRPKPVYAYLDINGFLLVVRELRQKGLTSGQIAQVFDVPVEQINLIWCKTL